MGRRLHVPTDRPVWGRPVWGRLAAPLQPPAALALLSSYRERPP